MTDRLVALDLHQSPHETAVSLLERLLDLLVQALPDSDDQPGRESLYSRVDAYKEALGHTDVERLRTCGEALLSACAGAAETHTRLRAVRRAEMTELLTMIRDMTVALTGEATAMTAEVTTAAARFAALGDIRDLRLLKNRLTAEVIRLKDTALQREERWQSKVASFARRIQLLEGQLVVTQEEATHDSLTGLANRRLYDRRLSDLLRDAQPFALVLVDVDDFKSVNDRHGHETGDSVLKTIARSLALSVRGEDMVARISGDEFALILENVPPAQAAHRVSAITACIGPALEAAGHPATSVSCGIAEWRPGDTVSILTKRADDALYESKHHGRGRVTKHAS